MTLVAISQRVVEEPRYGERRDALDQNWARFLSRCGIVAAAVPNVPQSVESWVEALPLNGVLLTGGNDLVPAQVDVGLGIEAAKPKSQTRAGQIVAQP